MSYDRYYYKKKYTGDYSAFGTAAVFTLIGILSLVFRRLSIDFIGLAWWGYWFFIPAFFIFIGAISHLYSDRRMRDSVFYAVQNRSGRIRIETFAAEVGIKPQDLLRILVDLRVSKGIQYKYDGATGEIIFGEDIQYKQAPEFEEPIPKKQVEVIFPSGDVNYCPYCGHKASASMQFCENCGSKLQ